MFGHEGDADHPCSQEQRTRGDSGRLMLRERIASQSEVIRAVLLKRSPYICCGRTDAGYGRETLAVHRGETAAEKRPRRNARVPARQPTRQLPLPHASLFSGKCATCGSGLR